MKGNSNKKWTLKKNQIDWRKVVKRTEEGTAISCAKGVAVILEFSKVKDYAQAS